MMTEKLYWNDMYLKDFDAKVVSVNGKKIILDKTAFYPASGGQPSDTGTLTVNGNAYNIVELKKSAEDIIHITDSEIKAKPGDIAHGSINWQRRFAFMRHHTAIHIVDAVIENSDKPGILTGGIMYEDRAHFDVDMPDLNRESAQALLDKANKIVEEGHDVVAKFVNKEEALKIPRLSRTEPGRKLLASLDTIRVVEITGIDVQADGGRHVKNTREVGKLRLSDFENKGTHRKRVEIILE